MKCLKTSADVKALRTFLRCVFAPGLLAFGLSVSALAQHGGGGGGHASGGGHEGGFSGGGGVHSGFSSGASSFRGGAGVSSAGVRGSRSFAAHPGYGGTGQFRSSGANAYGARGFTRGASAARPAFYNRGGLGSSLNRGGANGYRFRGRGQRFGYGYGYPGLYSSNLFYNPFFFDPFFGFGDPFYDDGDTFWDTGSVNGPDASLGYGSGAPNDGGAMAQADPSGAYAAQPYSGQSYPAYGPENEPGPWAPAGDGSQGTAPLRPENPVTIVFKDGRPAEHIRNYALTRSALLVTDARMREIPLDEIDLAMTQRVNHAAGIDFKLPQSY